MSRGAGEQGDRAGEQRGFETDVLRGIIVVRYENADNYVGE